MRHTLVKKRMVFSLTKRSEATQHPSAWVGWEQFVRALCVRYYELFVTSHHMQERICKSAEGPLMLGTYMMKHPWPLGLPVVEVLCDGHSHLPPTGATSFVSNHLYQLWFHLSTAKKKLRHLACTAARPPCFVSSESKQNQLVTNETHFNSKWLFCHVVVVLYRESLLHAAWSPLNCPPF